MRNLIRSLIRWEWLLFLLLLPLFIFPDGYRSLVLLLIPGLWIVRKLVVGRFIPPTPYDVALLLMLFMLVIGQLVTFDAAFSAPKVASILLGIGLFYATVDFGRDRALWPIVAAILAAGVLIALTGLIGVEWLPPFAVLNRIRLLLPSTVVAIPGTVGGLINANELAGVLNWVAPLMFACLIGLFRQPRRKRKAAIVALAIGTMILFFVLIATLSRGGILALGAGIALVVAFFVTPRWRIVIAIGFIVTLLILVSYSAGRIEQDIVGDTLGLGGRLEIWSRALLAIQDFPLTGVGLNGFRRVVHELYPLFAISPDIDLAHAHNHLLQAALDLGLPGLTSYLAIWLISAALLWNTRKVLVRRHAMQHLYYALTAGLSGALLAGWIFGIFDTVALGARPAFIWWLLLGLTAALHYSVVYSGGHLRSTRRSPPDLEP